MPAALAAFQRWVEPRRVPTLPQGPPSQQFLARRPQLSTLPMGLGAVARIPTARMGEERPLPQRRETAPLPFAPAAERAGRLQLSTLRPEPGIGLLGETEEQLRERLTRARAAKEVLTWPGLAEAHELGQITLPEGLRFQAAEQKRADEAAEASFQREEKEYRGQLSRRALQREAANELVREGMDEQEAGGLAWDWVEAGVADARIKDIRARREKEAERKAKGLELATKERKVAGEERAALGLIPGAVLPGKIGPQTQEAAAFQAGAVTLPQARATTEKRLEAAAERPIQQKIQTQLEAWSRAGPQEQAAMEAEAEDAEFRGQKVGAGFRKQLRAIRGY